MILTFSEVISVDEQKAIRKCNRLLSRSLASEARAASSVARDAGERALRLEQAAHQQREHELRVQAAEAKLSELEARLASKLQDA